MCGRFTAKFTERLLRQMGFIEPLPLYQDRYNFPPTAQGLIGRRVDGALTGSLATWGLRPAWMKDSRLAPINARAENIANSPMFRGALRARRCIVPASGFYEWQGLAEGSKGAKQPWYIHRADDALLAFAGLWEPGEKGDTFTILTTAANDFMRPMGHRMPVILEPERIGAWLTAPDPALLVPAAAGVLTAHKVSTRVNSPKNDDPSLIDPVA